METLDQAVDQFETRSTADPGRSPLDQMYAYMPACVSWNRLEGRPRTNDLTRPMRAEVRDPLWLLARQWQVGEFEAQDAGTPVYARLSTRTSKPAQISFAGGPLSGLDPTQPLEATVERTEIEPDLMTGIHLGRRWLNHLDEDVGDPAVRGSFVAEYALAR